jgi:hypothetical protein
VSVSKGDIKASSKQTSIHGKFLTPSDALLRQSSCLRGALVAIGKTNRVQGGPIGSDRNDSVLDGVLHELGTRFDLQESHHTIFVRGDRPNGDVQHVRCFFHGAPFGQ